MIPPLSSRIRPVAAAALMALPFQAAWAAVDMPALEKLETQIQAVAEKNMPAVVAVTHGDGQGIASGSAVIISKSGLLVTAAHVVNEADILTVTFVDGRHVQARVLGADYDRDVAMALITEPGTYPFVELGDTKDLAVGDMVVAMGHPGGYDTRRKPPVRFGRVFNFDHNKFIRSDCTLVSGDSGGPLFGLDGKVIGIHSSVSTDMSQNHDAPTEVVRKDWDRLIMGERWGKNPLKSELSKLSKEELAGLNTHGFQARVMSEAMKNKGMVMAAPEEIAKWLKECGMKEEKVKSLSPKDLMGFVEKAAGGQGQLRAIPKLGKAPKLSDEERAGMDVERFRSRLMEEAMKNGGKIESSPDAIRQWIKDCGMNEERANALDAHGVTAMMGKVLGQQAELKTIPVQGSLPKISKEKSETIIADAKQAGLDLEQLRKRIVDAAVKNQGKLELNGPVIAQWLRECGMKEESVKALSDTDLNAYVSVAMGAGTAQGSEALAKADGAEKAASKDEATKADADLPGLNLDKLKDRLLAEAVKNNGALRTTPEEIAKMLTECGMNAEVVAKMAPDQLMKALQKALGSGVQMRTEGAPGLAPAQVAAIDQQDKEVLAAVKPGLDKLAPSVVALKDGSKTLAMGTIIRDNGFILTKHSEIAKAKGGLKVRLADGRELPGTEVQQFADHDLALVKIDTDSLPAVTIPESSEPLALGRLLFTPDSSPVPMLAMGVVSVKDRPLKEGGGYLGINLVQDKDGVEVGSVAPEGPTSKIGLQAKDRIVGLNDKKVTGTEELSALVRSLKPGSKVKLRLQRDGWDKTAEVTLGDRSKLPGQDGKPNPAVTIGTEVSDKSTGFPVIFQHDQPLNPNQCGSVVADLHGNVVGVNIARAGRVNTYAIPAGTVADLLKKVDFAALEKKASDTPKDKAKDKPEASKDAGAEKTSIQTSETEKKASAKPQLLKLEKNDNALDLKFTAIDGREVDLSSMKGKVVLVDFWATWCGPCVGEIPHVKEAYEKLHAKGFEIVGISFDGDQSTLERMIKEKGMEWPQYCDSKREIASKLQIKGIPTMWLINKKGELVDTNGRADLAAKVEKLLAE